MRIAVVSDSHLAPEAHAFNANWSAAREFIGSIDADLTIHLGDVTVDGVHDPGQFRHVQAISATWPTPIWYLPGNHDIGDNPPGPGVAAKEPLQMERLREFRGMLGPDHWVLPAEGWRLIGINAQLIGTDTSEEVEQWLWLAAQLEGSHGLPSLLFLHKPLFQDSPADAKEHYRYVPVEPRRRLFDLLSRGDVRVVVSGHTHQYRDRMVGGMRHIWVPSTAFYLPDALQDRVGEKVTGLGVLDLSRECARFHLVCPDGVIRHNIVDHPVYPEIRGR